MCARNATRFSASLLLVVSVEPTELRRGVLLGLTSEMVYWCLLPAVAWNKVKVLAC